MRFLRRLLKVLMVLVLVLVALFGLMQLVPYGRTHSNPKVTVEPRWDSPRTRELAKRACFDCHSNETRWPWYANVAPMSWVVQFDVQSARDTMNFSEWNIPYPLASTSSKSLRLKTMPTFKYRMAHPDADLTPQEIDDLGHGLDATFERSPPEGTPD